MVVDDHSVLREGLVSLFQQESDFEVVAEAGSVDDALKMARANKPELVLMDYGIMGGTGLDATRAILAELPETKIVFLTVHENDDDLFNAIRNGAVGYLLKDISAAKLIESLRGLMHGEAPLSRKMTGRLVKAFSQQKPDDSPDGFPVSGLTPRELEILGKISLGATNQEIAQGMYVSINTVKNHVHNILEKLHLENRRAAAKYAFDHGLADASIEYPSFAKKREMPPAIHGRL